MGRANPKASGPARPAPAGFAARQLAARVIGAVIEQRRPFEDALARASADTSDIEPRDRAFARLIISTVLRRHGELTAVLKTFLTKPLPDSRGELWPILLSASAQLVMLETPPHAAISMAVDQCHADPHARHFAGLANAVLRRVATEGPDDPRRPRRRDVEHSGLDDEALECALRAGAGSPDRTSVLARGAARHLIQVISRWLGRASVARRLLPTGSVRLAAGGRIEDLPGYAEGSWWVQDAAAALPARLLGDVAGLEVADLCAAPGGKTAELVSAGAHVTAVEQSADRAERLKENLKRLALDASVVVTDATAWQPGRLFDAVLLDAPCTSTGTLRRHPDILHLKRVADVAQLAALQSKLLDSAARLVKPGGLLVYCTCSLEPEEGEHQIRELPDAIKCIRARAARRTASMAWRPNGFLRTAISERCPRISPTRIRCSQAWMDFLRAGCGGSSDTAAHKF